MSFVFPPAPMPSLAVIGSELRFPVHHIYLIGRNYADHAREMGATPTDRAAPLFFCKPADAIVEDGAIIAYPAMTKELHHEVEMVVALHSGGTDIAEADALGHVFGYGVGIDYTRRDLQAVAKAKSQPWEAAKSFANSAPVSALRRAGEIGHPTRAALTLEVNGARRQSGDLAQMIFSPAQVIAELSKYFPLQAGDLIFTGTPAGVAAMNPGDRWIARLEGVAELRGGIA